MEQELFSENASRPKKSKSARKRRWTRGATTTVVILALLLGALRIALPDLLQRYVNRTLDRIPDYDGSIGDVDLALIRGAYVIKDVKIVKTTGKVPVPLFKARKIDFSVLWRAVFQGKAVGEIFIDEAELNFVQSKNERSKQTSVDDEWLEVVKDLFPLRINRFELVHSEIHYRDFQTEPKVDVMLGDLTLLGTNFSNTRSATVGEPATINANAKLEKVSPVRLASKVYPAAKDPTFDVDLSIREIPLTSLNDFLRAYGNFDAEGGSVALYADFAAGKGKFSGSVKPIVKNAKVLRWKTDSSSPLEFLWEGFVALLSEVFENQRHDQIATTVPFSGTFKNPRSSTWETVLGILENAFVVALKPGGDKSISVEKLLGGRSPDTANKNTESK